VKLKRGILWKKQ